MDDLVSIFVPACGLVVQKGEVRARAVAKAVDYL